MQRAIVSFPPRRKATPLILNRRYVSTRAYLLHRLKSLLTLSLHQDISVVLANPGECANE